MLHMTNFTHYIECQKECLTSFSHLRQKLLVKFCPNCFFCCMHHDHSLFVLSSSVNLYWKIRTSINSFTIFHKLFMRLNEYLFTRVNNKEHERGQRSVVWLKHGQPCLHHLHVLSTVFLWRPLSSFSLWIILLPPSLPPLNFLILPLLISVTGAWFHWRGGSWLEGAGLPAMGA